jgi:hypothetical protein
MSLYRQKLWVEAIPGEAMCYRVQSRTSPSNPHRVELSAHGGRSECSCKGWRTTRWKVIKAGCAVGDPDSMCAHVVVACWHHINYERAFISTLDQPPKK